MSNQTTDRPAQDLTAAAISRRRLLAAAGGLTLGFMINGRQVWLSPREARAEGMPVDPFTEAEARTLTRLGNILTVNAGDEGLTHFISAQLRKPSPESLLILRYMDVPPPHDGFYKAGLAALDKAAMARHGAGFSGITTADAETLVADMGTGRIENWDNAPPAPFFYFVVRADAIDVTYGTVEGFARMEVPYLAHIEPDEKW